MKQEKTNEPRNAGGFSKITSFFKGIKPSFYIQLALMIFLFVFLFLPLIVLLTKADGASFKYVFENPKLGSSVLNSLIYSLVGGLLATVLATVVAYFLSRSRIKGKKWLVLLLTLPMLIPTLSIGLGTKFLFSPSGFVNSIFGTSMDGSGFFDLIFGSVVFSFPISFLLIYDALLYEDRSIYDASNTLGAGRFRSFIFITIPYLRRALISSFFAAFTLIIADYGLPMEVAGNVDTLPMFLYEEVKAGTPIGYGRGAVISLLLLVPAIIAFVSDLMIKDSGEGVSREETIKPTKLFNGISIAVIVIVAFILFTPSIAFIAISFMKDFPLDKSFSFVNYETAFSSKSSLSITQYIRNSLVISILVGLVGTVLAYLIGYVSTRCKGKLAKPLHLFSIATLAVPGLVLGLGYVFLFKSTKGWFAGTIIILVVVNMIHYFSSPYLMSKNAFGKINRDYETVADTLGIGHVSLFFKVIIPNSIGTIVQMFSYFFINSMITISAVSLLASVKIMPLAVAITRYEPLENWAMESVISTFILLINITAKIVFDTISDIITKSRRRKVEERMSLTRFEFNVLEYLSSHNNTVLTQRQIADAVTLSLGTTNKLINQFVDEDVIIIHQNRKMELTEKGFKLLEPYKVRKAIIIAAGFGSRMVPVTLDTPKPLVKVNGVRIIDTLIDALIAQDITNITIVVGYKKEQFQELLKKYPTLKFIENPIYNESNNISSVYCARDIIDRCYICEADLVISNPKVITKYQYTTNYLGAYVTETDDWCFFKKGNYIHRVAIGGENCWHMIGISYWNEEDSKKLREDVVKVFNSRGGKEKYWDNVPLTVCRKDFKIEVRECPKSDVTEIDNFSELCILDASYKNYPTK